MRLSPPVSASQSRASRPPGAIMTTTVCSTGTWPGSTTSRQVTSPLNHCRLYKNLGNGTFENVADKAGVANKAFAKGVAWGDYDDDGDLDLYVSNMRGTEPAVPQ